MGGYKNEFTFKNNSAVSLSEILDNFSRFSKLYSKVSPLSSEHGDLFTASRGKTAAGAESLPVYTDRDMLTPPLFSKKTIDFLNYAVYSPSPDFLVFNPAVSGSPGATLDKKMLSLLIGGLSPSTADENPEKALLACDFHRAHYLAFSGTSPASPAVKAEILSMLGLYEQGLALLKTETTQDSLFEKSRIQRMSGDLTGAAASLAAVSSEGLNLKREMEKAWLTLLSGKTEEAHKIFLGVSGGEFKQEAFFGIAVSLLSGQNLTDDKADEAVKYLTTAAELPGKNKLGILLYAGGLFYNSGDFNKADDYYSKAFRLTPSMQLLSMRALCDAKREKFREAVFKAAECALFDSASALKVLAEIPDAKTMIKNSLGPDLELAVKKAPPQNNAAPKSPSARTQLKQVPPVPAASPASSFSASLEPADVSARTKAKQETEKARGGVQFETLYEMSEKNERKTTENKGDFTSRAFAFASALEEEYGKKIYFNLEGLTDIERKIRITFIQQNLPPAEAVETVRNCAAFLSYFLKERYKAKLLEYPDFDPWAWPAVITKDGNEVITFPSARIWQVLWNNKLPDQGWILKYTQYLSAEVNSPSIKSYGIDAARAKVRSHPEKIFDAEMEHRKNVLLASTLNEFRDIELGRTGILKIERKIRELFQPGVPPTSEGWKLLRALGHLNAAIMAKDFKATWFNVENNDGLWAMELPWRTLIFPIGKIYKAASTGESIVEYYDAVVSDKLKY